MHRPQHNNGNATPCAVEYEVVGPVLISNRGAVNASNLTFFVVVITFLACIFHAFLFLFCFVLGIDLRGASKSSKLNKSYSSVFSV